MILEILKECDALLEGHFLLSSGKHSDRYCQCAKLLQYPDKAEVVLKEVAEKLQDIEFDGVIGPAMGGILVAYELGRQLKKPAMFTERENGVMTLRRGFEIKKGEKFIITEDVVTTGKSFKEAEEVIKALGGEVVAVVCIVDRSKGLKFDYPLISAIKLDVESYDSDSCPLCQKGISYIKPGSRKIEK